MNVLDLEGLRYFYQQYIADLQKTVNAPGRPDILNGMTMLGGNALSKEEGKVTDTAAQYEVIEKSLAETGEIFLTDISLPKGLYSVMVRMKVSDITSTENILKLEILDGENTTVKYIKPSMFRKANTFMTVGCAVENTSGTLKIALRVDKALIGKTAGVDYLALSPAMVGITSIG